MLESSQIANARLGIRLFLIYSVFYFGFVLVNAFAAEWSEIMIFPGINMAVLWGFALIGLAFLLAMIYGLACRPEAAETSHAQTPPHSDSTAPNADAKGAGR